MLALHLPELAIRRRRTAAILVAMRRFGTWCLRCIQRAEQRRHLAELDARMLKDVGITPEQAREESAKPWWRA